MNATKQDKTKSELRFFLGLVFLVSLVFFGVIKNYLMPCFWAVVFAVVFNPFYQKVCRRFPSKPSVSAGLTVLTIFVSVIAPLSLICLAAVNQGTEFFEHLSNGDYKIGETVHDIQAQIPFLPQVLEKTGVDLDSAKDQLNDSAAVLTTWIGGKALGIGQEILETLVQIALMIYLLFFFLKDSKCILDRLIFALPLGDRREKILLKRFASVTRATVRGSLLIALLQGTIGGVMFFLLGIKGAAILGAAMVLMALLPVGPTLIWLPVAINLLAKGFLFKGTVVIGVGALLIGLMDNFLRPRLVGQDTKMPDYLILISTLGGIAEFGLTGFIIGPVVAALFITIWGMVGSEIAT